MRQPSAWRCWGKSEVMCERKQLTDAWCEQYKQYFGCPYLFQGAKDGAAAGRLLKLGMAVEEIMGIARSAWGHGEWFNCKHAASLAGFVCRFNEIRQELKRPSINGAILIVWRDEYERVIKRMASIRAGYGDHQSWRDCDRQEWGKLKERKGQLQKNLGVMV